ncbi:phosphoinositide 5-phosphatase INP51 NDAI_0B01090 [Naumovozyma dairenensis CBS 421]|uniref:phosphoinositide 5-phosphatase n=1 Tax=Naumovozyma dairenensis (strain ATCC 10597 / BCRC 20456 / CBS 421 / NBRC 0211 / NRRL Y-12639) TaxID=1071378 RepID=G0W5T2_NAUDC|nr:hypothetical protein NDAI_0B01090 [Naumovozyma dairenensis CBS 421]CCD23143.1 hypothetical protein NDAI_0B01090 [Naumovozyma dairenensis CBS 421]
MRLFIGRNPRSIVLASNNYYLSFQKYHRPSGPIQPQQPSKSSSVVIKILSEAEVLDEARFTEIKSCIYNGLLGLISTNGSVFLAIISGVQNVGFPRWKNEGSRVVPNETIYKVLDVDFYSIENDAYDPLFFERNEQNYDKLIHEHPCGSFKKLFGDGTFYFSRDFDISNTVKNHGLLHNLEYTIDNQDLGFIWNTSLTSEIISWRNRVPIEKRHLFDNSNFLTFVVRGFCKTAVVEDGDNTASVTIISRISAENKLNAFEDGLNDEGKVGCFVETEVVVTTKKFIFSYTQVEANIPLFWESVENQLLYGRKIKMTRTPDQSQTAFDKHFDSMESKYGVVSIVNLIKPKSETQESLALVYQKCAEARGTKITNLEYTSGIFNKAPHKLIYLLQQDIYEFGAFAYDMSRGVYFGKQTGVLRISAFDSIEKPLQVAKIVSKEVLELATKELQGFEITSLFIDAHDRIWSENYYWLDRTYSKNGKNPMKYAKIYYKLFSSKVKLFYPLHYYVSQHLRQMKSNFTFQKDITIFAGTFNISGKVSKDDITEWIFPKGSNLENPASIYIIGLEEVVELTPGHMLSTDPFIKQFWERKIITLLNNSGGKEKYVCTWSNQLGGLLLMLFMSSSEYLKIKHIEGDVKKTGFGGIASNKGAVAVSFNYSATKFCVLVSHLAAGLDNVEQRHNDYKTIVKNINFGRGLRIKDHDAVIWMGDFNYRILMSNEDVRRLIASKEYTNLFLKDQLNQQMIAGESFPYYHEMAIDFPPTYKFDPGTKTYDTSEKMRIPAWTDRILSRGEVLKQLSYGCAEDILFSDHRPVYATFNARVTVVDEQKKEALSIELHEKIMEKLANLTEEEKDAVLSERILLFDGEERSDSNLLPNGESLPSVADSKRGKLLPPPSSDTRKWWIGNGKQVKVTLDIDPNKYMINPKRNPNPFIEMDEEGANIPFFIPRTK